MVVAPVNYGSGVIAAAGRHIAGSDITMDAEFRGLARPPDGGLRWHVMGGCGRCPDANGACQLRLNTMRA